MRLEIFENIKSGKNALLRIVSQLILRFRLKNSTFTIISNNCWGAEIYKEAGLQYLTPFIGLYIFAPCYIRMLGNLRKYLSQSLKFATVSKYDLANERREALGNKYPIGILGGGEDSVEIHFAHYKNELEAKEKWIRRIRRINWNNLFFKADDRDLANDDFLNAFDRLPFPNKVLFVTHNNPSLQSAVWIEDRNMDPFVPDGMALYLKCKKYFDVAAWLNRKGGHVNIILGMFYGLLEKCTGHSPRDEAWIDDSSPS